MIKLQLGPGTDDALEAPDFEMKTLQPRCWEYKNRKADRTKKEEGARFWQDTITDSGGLGHEKNGIA